MLKKTTMILCVIAIMSNFTYSEAEEKTFQMPTKINYEIRNSFYKEIYYNGEVFKYKRSGYDQSKYRTVHGWCYTSDHLLMSESIQAKNYKMLSDNLYLVDVHLNIVDTIYKADMSRREKVKGWMISPNDSLLFISCSCAKYVSINANQNELVRWDSTYMMDFKSKKILRSIDGGFGGLSQQYGFSPDIKKLVYTTHSPDGIYIYDIEQNSKKKVLDYGFDATWCPSSNIIAFYQLPEQRVCFLNAETNEISTFYQCKRNEHISNITWTPDGKYLYIRFWKHNLISYFSILGSATSTEKIIRVKDKVDISGSRELHLRGDFTWKP